MNVFFLIGLFSGCTYEKAVNPFAVVPPGKTLLYFSQFELIDDFTTGVSKNRYSCRWETTGIKGAKISLETEKKNSLHGVFGGALRVLYDLPTGGVGKVSSGLDGLDMSRANALVGRMKTSLWRAFGGELALALEDSSGKRVETKITSRYIWKAYRDETEWTDIAIPTKVFKGINFNRLKNFELILSGADRPLLGTLVFDEIAFFGPFDLFVESARDNLKGVPSEDNTSRREQLVQTQDTRKFLRLIAEDTWRYFEWTVDRETNLLIDHIRLGRTKGVGSYISPAGIAFYWLACIAASDLGFISREEAVQKIGGSLRTLDKLERWKEKFYYNFYRTGTLQTTRRYVSSVDNGWLVAALAVVRQAFPGRFDNQIGKIISEINFSEFYDPANGQLKIGFDEEKGSSSPYHYGLLVSEARLMSYVAIGKGDLPKTHWARIYRTLPKAWEWQTQVPQGTERSLFGTRVFEGYYVYEGKKIVPSWGGSLFEFLSPAILLNEQTLAVGGLGANNIVATEAQIDYALRQKKYPIWGIAPAAVQNGKQWAYKEFGVKAIAGKGYRDEGVITPYASVLAIEIKPREVVDNLRKMLALFPEVYGPYGFYDSIDLERKRVNPQYLALDHGMTLIALANYLENGCIRNRFHRDPIGKRGEMLLTDERFFD